MLRYPMGVGGYVHRSVKINVRKVHFYHYDGVGVSNFHTKSVSRFCC